MSYDLDRFVRAQEEGSVYSSTYEDALREVRQGRRKTWWYWYVFPQLRAVGKCPTAVIYGIEDAGEATAYLAHPVLGEHLVEVSRAFLDIEGKSALQVMGPIGCAQLQSCMTLFASVEGSDPVFREVLGKFFNGGEDQETVQQLR